MSALSAFLKTNKTVKPNTSFVATKSLCDVDGKPLTWEIKAVTTKEAEAIREECMYEVPVKGKPNQYRHKLDTKAYMAKLAVKGIVFPDLYDAELQDSYGVRSPEDLIMEMVDNPTEYGALVAFIQEYSELTDGLDGKVAKAKN